MAHSISNESGLEDESQRLVSDCTTVREGWAPNAMPFTRATVLDRENIRVLPDAKKRLISLDAQRRRVERLVRMLHCLFIVSESACRCALLGRFGDDVKRPRGGLRA
jgi:hypothetical protein